MEWLSPVIAACMAIGGMWFAYLRSRDEVRFKINEASIADLKENVTGLKLRVKALEEELQKCHGDKAALLFDLAKAKGELEAARER